jgi:radical SAM superfamily enzyme YgiQ (UPF0313 family)
METEIALFIPPSYDCHLPPLGTPALISFLKAHGVIAFQRDLNINCHELFKDVYSCPSDDRKLLQEKVARKVYYSDVLTQDNTLPLAIYGYERPFAASFAFTERMLSSSHLHRFLADRRENAYVDFFRKRLLGLLKRRHVDLVGFSITSPSQVLASFTFGYHIKEHFPATKVVLGGQWISFYVEELMKKKDFSAFYDFLIIHEGETPLLHLIEHMRGNRALEDVPNLVSRRNNKWEMSAEVTCEDLKGLPAPDFRGLPLKKYSQSAAVPSLTYETARGCYWGKCIFCGDYPLPKFPYREKPVALVIKEINELIRKYRVRRLVISNVVLSPRQMRTLSAHIIKEGIKISWWAMARFDKNLDRETLELARESGCSMIGFGLESINQRVLNFIEKGTKRYVIERIVRDCQQLGLPLFLQAVIGLPSESIREALETIGFVSRSRIPAAFNVFYVIPKTPVYLHPESYGLEVVANEELPFKYFHPFRHMGDGIDWQEACRMAQGLRKSTLPLE